MAYLVDNQNYNWTETENFNRTFPYSNIWAAGVNCCIQNPRPSYPPQIISWICEMRKLNFFQGGTEKEWSEVRRISFRWLNLAKAQGYLTNIKKIKRLNKELMEQSLFTHPGFFSVYAIKQQNISSAIAPSTLKELAETTIQDAAKEMTLKKEGLSCLEVEVLKKGGIIIGLLNNVLMVYFPFKYELIMDKLLGRVKEKSHITVSGVYPDYFNNFNEFATYPAYSVTSTNISNNTNTGYVGISNNTAGSTWFITTGS